MNEVLLVYYGQPEQLNSALLLNLNIVEFREESSDFSGLYAIEQKFGKQIQRKLSLDFAAGTDWLIYRYLSTEEIQLLKKANSEKRIYLLLQNYMTLEYFLNLVPEETPSLFFIVGQAEALKTVSHASERIKTKNLLVAKTVVKKNKDLSQSHDLQLPEVMAGILKLMLNPADEWKLISTNLMHSNRRIFYRFFEMLHFLHFILYMAGVFLFRIVPGKMFWKSVSTIGFLKVSAVKLKYFVRHVLLMAFYKLWGVAVDSANFMIRTNDRLLGKVYYRTIHRIYFATIHVAIHQVWLRLLNPLIYKLLLPLYYWVYQTIFFNILHKSFFRVRSHLGKFWSNYISPVFYATLHKFYHRRMKPAVTFVYFNLFHKAYHSSIKPMFTKVFYSVFHSGYYRVVKPMVEGIYFKIIHKAYHQIVKPVIEGIYFSTIHLAYHRAFKPFFTFLCFRVVQELLWYKFFHRIYFAVIVRLYYWLYVFILHRIFPWVKFNIFIKTHHFFIFTIKHYALMAVYKLYGFLFDILMILFRVTKLYLLYPFFKMYWFAAFQYNKRIKKYFYE